MKKSHKTIRKIAITVSAVLMLGLVTACGGKEEKTETTAAVTEAQDTMVESTTAATEEISEVIIEETTEVAKSDYEVLEEYVACELIPKYGIFDPTQKAYTYNMAAFEYSFEYDYENHTVVQTGWRDVVQEMTADEMKAADTDFRGIYYAHIQDYDGDGTEELLVIRADDSYPLELTTAGTTRYKLKAEIYSNEATGVKLIRDTDLVIYDEQIDEKVVDYFYIGRPRDKDAKYEIDGLCIISYGGNPYLQLYRGIGGDITWGGEYALVDLADFSYDAHLSYCGSAQIGGGTTMLYYMNNIGENPLQEENLGSGADGAKEAVDSKGFSKDRELELFSAFTSIRVANDFQIKYLFEKDGAGVNAEGEENPGKAEAENLGTEVLGILEGKKYERCLGQVGLSELTFSKSGSEYVISVTKGDRNGPGGVDKGLATASITGLKQIDEYTYSFDTKDAKDEYSARDELTEDGLTIHYLEIADWIDGTWNIYVPRTPVSMIPAPLWTGWHKDDAGTASMLEQWQENGVTKCYVLYHPDDREEAAYVESK